MTPPAPRRHDRGTTLTELLVTMVVSALFFGVVGTVVLGMYDAADDQQARSTNLDTNRLLVQVLDRQVRYANVVNAPLTTGAGSAYVTWRVGSSTATLATTAGQTCRQWRLATDGSLQHRSWPAGSAAGVTPWTTVGRGVRASGSPFALETVATGPVQRQALTVRLVATSGRKAVETPLTVSFTALNSRSAAVPTTPVCQEVQPS